MSCSLYRVRISFSLTDTSPGFSELKSYSALALSAMISHSWSGAERSWSAAQRAARLAHPSPLFKLNAQTSRPVTISPLRPFLERPLVWVRVDRKVRRLRIGWSRANLCSFSLDAAPACTLRSNSTDSAQTTRADRGAASCCDQT